LLAAMPARARRDFSSRASDDTGVLQPAGRRDEAAGVAGNKGKPADRQLIAAGVAMRQALRERPASTAGLT
jgi:hypothetical protein